MRDASIPETKKRPHRVGGVCTMASPRLLNDVFIGGTLEAIVYFAKVPVRQASWRRCFSAFMMRMEYIPALLEWR